MLKRYDWNKLRLDSSRLKPDIMFKIKCETTGSVTEVPAHKFILGASSEVFAAQFFGDYPDTKTSEIEIKDASPNVFKVFIEAIYSRTNVIKGMEDCSLLLQLKSLADKFLIKDLVTAATKALKDIHISKRNVFLVVREAKEYEDRGGHFKEDSEALLEASAKFLAVHYPERSGLLEALVQFENQFPDSGILLDIMERVKKVISSTKENERTSAFEKVLARLYPVESLITVFDLRLEAIVREDEETGARLLVLRAADEEQEGVQFCTVITGDLESTSVWAKSVLLIEGTFWPALSVNPDNLPDLSCQRELQMILNGDKRDSEAFDSFRHVLLKAARNNLQLNGRADIARKVQAYLRNPGGEED